VCVQTSVPIWIQPAYGESISRGGLTHMLPEQPQARPKLGRALHTALSRAIACENRHLHMQCVSRRKRRVQTPKEGNTYTTKRIQRINRRTKTTYETLARSLAHPAAAATVGRGRAEGCAPCACTATPSLSDNSCIRRV
jgi:hypothetical protein